MKLASCDQEVSGGGEGVVNNQRNLVDEILPCQHSGGNTTSKDKRYEHITLKFLKESFCDLRCLWFLLIDILKPLQMY